MLFVSATNRPGLRILALGLCQILYGAPGLRIFRVHLVN